MLRALFLSQGDEPRSLRSEPQGRLIASSLGGEIKNVRGATRESHDKSGQLSTFTSPPPERLFYDILVSRVTISHEVVIFATLLIYVPWYVPISTDKCDQGGEVRAAR